MATKDKSIEEKLAEAAAEGRIEYAESDTVEDYTDIAAEFLENILGLNLDECFISDESQLSDFTTCGMPDCYVDEAETYAQITKVWDNFIRTKILNEYDVVVNVTDTLVTIFEKIRQARSAKVH